MPLETAQLWEDDGEVQSWMLDKLKDTRPPASLTGCLNEDQWSQIYQLYSRRNLLSENTDFLIAVGNYKKNLSLDMANEIYEEFIPGSANSPINISAPNKEKLDDWYRDALRYPTDDMFDNTFDEILRMNEVDCYKRFLDHTSKAQTGLRAQEEEIRKRFEGDDNISRPVVKEFDITKIDRAVVDEWNKNALKELKNKGDETGFAQYGDLVIIEHPKGKGAQPYLAWVKTQAWYDDNASVALMEKGGAFGSGSLKVDGSTDPGKFEITVRKATKAKFVF